MTGEERHQFVLDPYPDERWTSCPLCKAPTKLRKFALAVEPGVLVAQGLSCRSEVDGAACSVRVSSLPDETSAPLPVDVELVVEFYSRSLLAALGE